MIDAYERSVWHKILGGVTVKIDIEEAANSDELLVDIYNVPPGKYCVREDLLYFRTANDATCLSDYTFSYYGLDTLTGTKVKVLTNPRITIVNGVVSYANEPEYVVARILAARQLAVSKGSGELFMRTLGGGIVCLSTGVHRTNYLDMLCKPLKPGSRVVLTV